MSMELVQNSVSFGQALGKTGLKPGFSAISKEAVPKTEVLEQLQWRRLSYENGIRKARCTGAKMGAD
ncbi:hypothetical protein Holit_01121 [Hollandina sp. SP2]